MPFLPPFSRYLQFILGDKPVENSLGEDSYGDRPALPTIAEDAWRGFGWPCAPIGGVPTPPLMSTFHNKRSKL